MSDNITPVGSPVTLAELKALGGFVRWQDIGPRVADLVANQRLPSGYPLVASRLPTDGLIDLCVGERWRQVKFIRMEGSLGRGERRVVHVDEGTEKSTRYEWYEVAPAGHYTEWHGPRPESIKAAKLLDRYELAQQAHVTHSQEVEAEDWPYLTFLVRSSDPRARWVDDMWTGSYTLHAANIQRLMGYRIP